MDSINFFCISNKLPVTYLFSITSSVAQIYDDETRVRGSRKTDERFYYTSDLIKAIKLNTFSLNYRQCDL